ncbi:MAG: site-specific integrase [Lentisphaeria bacterium]|nr:site-specific integrase [Lentisphaeria bacterium]
MYLRGNYWHYDFYINKTRYRGTTGFTVGEKKKAVQMVETIKTGLRDDFAAELIIKTLQKKIKHKSTHTIDCATLWQLFCTTCEIRAQEHRRKIYFTRLREFCTYMKENFPETEKIEDITEYHTKSYRSYLYRQNISNSTKNDHIAALKMIFSHFKSMKYISSDPFRGIKKFPSAKVKREIFTQQELNLIMQKSSGWMRHLFIVTLCTGLREGDAALLKKDELDGKLEWITIKKTRKTGVEVDIPIPPFLREHLQNVLRNGNDSPYVYPELAGMYLRNNRLISSKVKKFFREIGISDTSTDIPGYKNRVSVKDVHSFRHTFIYFAACSNIPLPVIQSAVGHTSQTMTLHYMNHATRNEKSQLEKAIPEEIFTSGHKKHRN